MQRRRVCAARWSAPGACTRSGRWSDLHIQRVLDWGEHLQRHHGQRYGLARVDISACGGSCQQRPLSGKAPVWAIGPTSIFTSKAHVVGQQVLDVAGRARARCGPWFTPRHAQARRATGARRREGSNAGWFSRPLWPLRAAGEIATPTASLPRKMHHYGVLAARRRETSRETCTTMAFWPRDVGPL